MTIFPDKSLDEILDNLEKENAKIKEETIFSPDLEIPTRWELHLGMRRKLLRDSLLEEIDKEYNGCSINDMKIIIDTYY